MDQQSPSSSPMINEEEIPRDSETPEHKDFSEQSDQNEEFKFKRTKGSRRQPSNAKRKIGQEVINRVDMSEKALKNIKTEMEEIPFDIDDGELVMQQIYPTMFKKFKILKKDGIGSTLHEIGTQNIVNNVTSPDPERVTNPILLHSPLFRSFNIADPNMTTFESILPPVSASQTDRIVSSNDVLNHLVMSPPKAAQAPLELPGYNMEPLESTFDDGTSIISHLFADSLYAGLEGITTSVKQHDDPSVVFAQTLKKTDDITEGLAFEIPPLEIEALEEALEAPLLTSDVHKKGGVSEFNQKYGFLAGLSEYDLYNYFVNVVADDLVPIPFEESPFYRQLPVKAQVDKFTWDLVVAFAAAHRAVKFSNNKLGEMHPSDFDLVEKLVHRCECHLEVALAEDPRSNQSLMGVVILGLIELDRGLAKRWWLYTDLALNILKLRPSFFDWDLDNEINSMLIRIVGFTTSMANILCGPAPRILTFPSWPQWSGSLDHLTGVDLNLLPLFSEVAYLIRLVMGILGKEFTPMEQETHFARLDPIEDICVREKLMKVMTSIPLMQRIRMRALRILQRINDYWIEEFIPDSDISSMCILFQEAVQIHLLRRVLLFPASHPTVQRIIKLGIYHLERYIVPQSRIQRNMPFILGTFASEALDLRHRTILVIRMRNMAEFGFKHHWKLCRDVKQHWKTNKSLICSRKYSILPR